MSEKVKTEWKRGKSVFIIYGDNYSMRQELFLI